MTETFTERLSGIEKEYDEAKKLADDYSEQVKFLKETVKLILIDNGITNVELDNETIMKYTSQERRGINTDSVKDIIAVTKEYMDSEEYNKVHSLFPKIVMILEYISDSEKMFKKTAFDIVKIESKELREKRSKIYKERQGGKKNGNN